MRMVRTTLAIVAMLFSASGCSQERAEDTEAAKSKPAEARTAVDRAQSDPTAADDHGKDTGTVGREKSPGAAPVESDQVAGGGTKSKIPSLALPYVSENFVGGLVIQSRQFLASRFAKSYFEFAVGRQNFEVGLAQYEAETGLDPRSIEVAVYLMDASGIEAVAELTNLAGLAEMADDANSPTADGGLLPHISSALFSFYYSYINADPVAQTTTWPAFVAHMSEDINVQRVMSTLSRKYGDSDEKSHAGTTYHVMNGYAVCVPDPRTYISAREELLLQMLNGKASNNPLQSRLESVGSAGEIALAISLSGHNSMVETLAADLPVLASLNQVSTASAALRLSGSQGSPLFYCRVTGSDSKATTRIHKTLERVVEATKQHIQEAQPGMLLSPEIHELGLELSKNVDLSSRGNRIELNVPVTDAYDRFLNAATSRFQSFGEQRRMIDTRMQMKNNMKNIGMGLHNFHRTYQSFPRANGMAGRAEIAKMGLSWRVWLLPYVDEIELFRQFNVDEPWDSEHNKALIEQMPDVYKVPDVTEPGKTSIHVFVGEHTPFGDGTVAPRISDLKDGAAKTVLAILAGPETAEVWTKPGGLGFDPQRPWATLGTIQYYCYMLLADGSCRTLSKDIDSTTLSRLIQHDDGQPIEGYGDYSRSTRVEPPMDAKSYNNRSVASYEQGDFDKAIADADEALRLDPKYADAYFNRGMAWAGKGDRDKAISDYNKFIQLDPTVAIAYSNRGLEWAGKGDYDKAISDCNTAIRLDPKCIGAYYTRGMAWECKGDFDKAIENYNNIIQLNPNIVAGYHTRGGARAGKGEYDKAINDYSKVIELDPTYAIAYNYRGMAWGGKGEYDKAINDYNTAIRLDPKCTEAYYNRGIAWEGKGEYDKAIGNYDEVIRHYPKDATGYNGRAGAWAGKGEYDKAISDYDKVIQLDPSGAIAYINRGFAWADKGEYDSAISDYNKAIRLEPKQADAYNALAWLQATCPIVRYRDGRKAIENALKACELSDWEDAYNIGTLAAAYAETAEFRKAIEWQKKAIELAPDREKQDFESRLKLYTAKRPFREERPPQQPKLQSSDLDLPNSPSACVAWWLACA